MSTTEESNVVIRRYMKPYNPWLPKPCVKMETTYPVITDIEKSESNACPILPIHEDNNLIPINSNDKPTHVTSIKESCKYNITYEEFEELKREKDEVDLEERTVMALYEIAMKFEMKIVRLTVGVYEDQYITNVIEVFNKEIKALSSLDEDIRKQANIGFILDEAMYMDDIEFKSIPPMSIDEEILEKELVIKFLERMISSGKRMVSKDVLKHLIHNNMTLWRRICRFRLDRLNHIRKSSWWKTIDSILLDSSLRFQLFIQNMKNSVKNTE